MKTKKSLLELFNQVRGIVDNPNTYHQDPDTKWFQDMDNRRDLYQRNPNSFLTYDQQTNNPRFPITDKNGNPNLSMMVKSLAYALYIQNQRPTMAGLDDIIHRLEKLISDNREDLDEIPTYRSNIVKTNDPTQMVNNLIYGPRDPSSKLAVMVSALGGPQNMNLGNVKIDTNTATNDFQHDVPEIHKVNSPDATRVNQVLPSADVQRSQTDISDYLKDVTAKTAQLAAMKSNPLL